MQEGGYPQPADLCRRDGALDPAPYRQPCHGPGGVLPACARAPSSPSVRRSTMVSTTISTWRSLSPGRSEGYREGDGPDRQGESAPSSALSCRAPGGSWPGPTSTASLTSARIDRGAPEGEPIALSAGRLRGPVRRSSFARYRRCSFFELLSLAGAYWCGSEKNSSPAGHGTAFVKKDALQAHLTALEEAKKRDHNRLGRGWSCLPPWMRSGRDCHPA